ncbi:TetR/AcrR family transcriptional regulator [Acuticoccus sp. M5D2P5]|uniref:TetR/AcrR family transcriptional regulator n=1 Tax=Acuticoccus kalidii TaxID=2910977 RepID=UPI001F3FAAE4|nr:TetR/AcrR family transcriptional regulator [Acuticoccus kalidii]
MTSVQNDAGETRQRRLSKDDRRRQLLDTALQIVRDEGADRLTLGRLAARAGVSKPVAYDHFGTRAGLLIALYKRLDREQSDALRAVLTTGERTRAETAEHLAATYIHCSVDTGGEWHAVGAALAGSPEMDAVHRELLDGYVRLFAAVLAPHSPLAAADLERRCVGLVGAGEALSAAMLRGDCSEVDAATAFAALIEGGLHPPG